MLEVILEQAMHAQDPTFGLDGHSRELLARVSGAACAGKAKGVLAVTVTLLLKKVEAPEQDIRLHQANMDGGFAGRTLDSKTVTPFLREEGFPHMASGSGWLTRTLEQPTPYNLDYPGKIQPREVKKAFLSILNAVEKGLDPRACLLFLFRQLADWRKGNAFLTLAKPTGGRIADIVSLVERHWNSDLPGVAKLPVLAVYAAYKCLVAEVEKYRGCELLSLRSHTSADSKDNMLGDIQVDGPDGLPFEAAEVKHKIPITLRMLQQMNDKFGGGGARTFFVLSTNETLKAEEMAGVSETLIDLRKRYGCQVIVNGVGTTLKYYLRLVKNTDGFVHEYVRMVETDNEIPFDLKRQWNEIVG